jgi:hypothetical protein
VDIKTLIGCSEEQPCVGKEDNTKDSYNLEEKGPRDLKEQNPKEPEEQNTQGLEERDKLDLDLQERKEKALRDLELLERKEQAREGKDTQGLEARDKEEQAKEEKDAKELKDWAKLELSLFEQRYLIKKSREHGEHPQPIHTPANIEAMIAIIRALSASECFRNTGKTLREAMLDIETAYFERDFKLPTDYRFAHFSCNNIWKIIAKDRGYLDPSSVFMGDGSMIKPPGGTNLASQDGERES